MSDEIHKNSDLLAEYKVGLYESRQQKREKANKEKVKIIAESGEVIRRVPITGIKLDPNACPLSHRRGVSARDHLERLLAGQSLPPVKVMEDKSEHEGTKKQYLLVDGYTVWKAHQRRSNLYRDGKLTTRLSQVEIETIQVKIVAAPVYQKARQNLRDRIRQFYKQFPGYPESRMAKELGCDIKTIKKHGADLITQWKEVRINMVKELNSQGESNREIAKVLKHRWPSARGLSQTVINRIIRVYRELGYSMPVFYVLDATQVMRAILSGQISAELEADLAELTKRPLIIRTDGTGIPGEQREMLPRSDELRSNKHAADWLVTDFKSKVEKSKLGNSDLCLIAHHFIPSVASAWARAVPGERVVRIESLWGIPEGLYWHSHDTFEVDTLRIDLNAVRPTASLNYKHRVRRRYKGTFIAPNEHGEWVHYQTAPPYDWKKSISKKRWIFDIARVTRQVAEREKCAAIVMWFIGNHPQATDHEVLPWFHTKSDFAPSPEAAPRQKRKSAVDYIIRDSNDWMALQEKLRSGKHIERVVVEPTDSALIRNRQFGEQLADFAASHKFVIELSGGILSHVYHMLQSRGAQVECVDLFGADEDVVDYNKLVRDKIPHLIEGGGERVRTVKLEGDALRTALLQKLVEEAFEALDASSGSELISELADAHEVIKALCQELKVSADEIEAERKEKENRRGGFEKGLMLVKTSTPHSIRKQSTTPDLPILELSSEESSAAIISEAADLPVKPLYRRSDLRRVDQQPEKLFTFETEISKVRDIEATLNFSMPIDDQVQRDFSLRVELRRRRTSVRGDVRLRLLPSQLRIEFSEQNDEDHGKAKK